MEKYKVSVVIPVYNVEKYLRQCLDSVVNQTLKEIEIIIVNDGSKDSSLAIMQEYAAKDDRIIIIDKANSGYGNSMNRGFDRASGEYVGIIESDDYAELDMFERLYNRAKEHELDVVKSGFLYYWSTPEEKHVPNPIASRITSGRTFCPLEDFKSPMEQLEFFNIKPTIWSAIYRRDFIRENNIRFNETPGASYQDASFNFKVWCCAKRVRLMEECFLHYRQDNENSSINSPGKVYCICDEYEEMFRFLSERPYEQGKLSPIVAAIQFDSYNWNYGRLKQNENLQKEFLERFQKDFLAHDMNGLLQKKYFVWYKWNNLHLLMEDPIEFHKKCICERYNITYVPPKKKGAKSAPVRWNAPAKKQGGLMGKLRGGMRCLKEHGFAYTVKHTFRKIRGRLSK